MAYFYPTCALMEKYDPITHKKQENRAPITLTNESERGKEAQGGKSGRNYRKRIGKGQGTGRPKNGKAREQGSKGTGRPGNEEAWEWGG